jgi:hypothetical protein
MEQMRVKLNLRQAAKVCHNARLEVIAGARDAVATII